MNLVAPETDQLEFYTDGVGGSGSEYERGLIAVTRWVKEHANETTVRETRVGRRKEYYAADRVELYLGSRSAYIFVRISDQRLTKIYIGRDSGV